jgi:hypothetical protein
MTSEDHKKLSQLLRADPRKVGTGKRMTPVDVDVRQPLSAATEREVVNSLKGQGTPRPDTGKPLPSLSDRLAIVVADDARSHRASSDEVALFLANRKDRRAGSIEILAVIRKP